MTKQQIKRLLIISTTTLLITGFIMAENKLFLNIKNKYLYCYHETNDTFCTEIEPVNEQKTMISSWPRNYYVQAYLVGKSEEDIVAFDSSDMWNNNTSHVKVPNLIEKGIEKKLKIGNDDCILDMRKTLYFYQCGYETEIFSFKNSETQDKYESIHNSILKEKNNINDIINFTYYATLFIPVVIFLLFIILLFILKTTHKYIMTGKIIDK